METKTEETLPQILERKLEGVEIRAIRACIREAQCRMRENHVLKAAFVQLYGADVVALLMKPENRVD